MGIYKPGRPYKYVPSTKIGNKPPAKAGEYCIQDNSGNITYIGDTNNLQRRMNEHHKIEQHSPSMNRSKGGEGRVASR